MKLIPVLAVTAAALVTSTAGHAKDCGNRPAKMNLPNGASASEGEMKATQAKFPTYAKEMSTYLQCLAGEMKAGKDEYEQVAAEWKQQEEIFQKTPAKQ